MNVVRKSPVAMAVAAALLASRAWALDTPAVLAGDSTEESLQSIIVTGTRQSDVKAIESPAPIQIISAEELQKTSTKPDLIQTLAALVPSFGAAGFGGDLSNLTLEAKLRGLSPNDTLILINGKRRHTTGNLSIGGGAYEGGAAADLNFIPVDAVERIEILTDGAAAQYGSDAIAGVINIILKKGRAGGNVQAEYGAYQDGGGVTDDVSGNVGFQPYEGAYFNLTGEYRNHGFSNRGAVDPRLFALSGVNTNVVNAPGYPYLNLISGDSRQQLKIFAFNSGFALPGGVQFYSFATYGKKNASAYENYRLPSQVTYTAPGTTPPQVTYQFPYGFTPLEAIDETDYSIAGGVKGILADWNWDLASGYGRDYADVSTIHTTNLSLYALNGIAPPDSYYDGAFKATQWTSTLDVSRDFDVGFAGPLNVAFGSEYRRDTYSIAAGIPASYYGAGAASYPGFNPADAGIHSRTNYAGYIDLASKVIQQLRIDVAGRFEHYSDFGSKTVGKITARYDFSPALALRGTASTGFRAPTLAEEYYTTTNVSPTSATVQLAPNSKGAADLGLGAGLQPETSRNYSVGLVFNPLPQLSATLDVYQIEVRDRIVASGTLSAALNGVVVAPAITQAIVDNGNSLDPTVVASGQTAVSLFTNGIDTRTRGADLTVNYDTDFGKFGRVAWGIAANYNDTTASNVRGGSAQLAGQPLFDQTAVSYLTNASPKYVINFGGLWSIDRLSVNVREVVYGNASEYTQDQGFTDRVAHITPAHVVYYNSSTGVIPTTNVDISYNALDHLTLSAGAINAFNRYPAKLNSELLSLYRAVASNSGVTQYPTWSPFGFNGGFYYLKANYSF